MSAAPLRQQRPSAQPRPRPGAAPDTRHLRPVAAPEQTRSLMPFMWACLAPVLLALAAVLLINTTMAEGAYERRDLKIEIAALHQEAQQLSEGLEANGAPAALAQRAAQLGMAPATALGSVSLSERIVLENGK